MSWVRPILGEAEARPPRAGLPLPRQLFVKRPLPGNPMVRAGSVLPEPRLQTVVTHPVVRMASRQLQHPRRRPWDSLLKQAEARTVKTRR